MGKPDGILRRGRWKRGLWWNCEPTSLPKRGLETLHLRVPAPALNPTAGERAGFPPAGRVGEDPRARRIREGGNQAAGEGTPADERAGVPPDQGWVAAKRTAGGRVEVAHHPRGLTSGGKRPHAVQSLAVATRWAGDGPQSQGERQTVPPSEK